MLSLVVIGALGAAGWFYRDRLPLDRIPLGFFNRQPQVVWLETNVRSEPPDLPIQVNGAPIDAAAGGIVRFAAEGEPVVVSTVQGCRRVEQTLSPSDAGGDVVLLVDSERYAGTFDPGIPGARVTLNGKSVGQAPVDLELNLCDANELEISAPGYKQASLSLPAQTRPVDVRTALAAWTVEKIPTGKLVIGDTAVKLVYYLDGKRLGTGARELELPEGRYKLRFKNEAYWIDETHTVEIAGGKTLDPELRPPALTDLVVQAFPANCKVFLRRPGGSWKYVDDTPLSRRVAVGTYEVRVTFNPTGENKERTVKLGPGDNAPVRISFSGG